MCMKKMLAVLLSFVLMLGCVPVAMAADISSTVSIDGHSDNTAYPTAGDELSFAVALNNLAGVGAFEFEVNIPDGVTYVGHTLSAIEGFNDCSVDVYDSYLKVTAYGHEAGYEGTLSVLDFTVTVDEDATGTLELTVSNVALYNRIGSSLPAPGVQNTSVTIHNHTASDRWSSDDEQHWHECVCGEKLDVAAHTWGEWSEDTATCVDPGEKSHKCTICGKPETVKTNPTGNHIDEDGDNKCDKCKQVLCKDGDHVEETVYGYPATCTEPGLTDGVKCSACGEMLVEQEVIPAKGHDYVGVVTTPATCTEPGEMTYTCDRCGDSYTEEIPALGHNWQYDELTGNLVCGNCGDMMSVGEDADVVMDENGTIIMTITLEDGTVIVVYKYTTGVQITVATSPEGVVVSVVINIPSKVSNEAVQSDEPVVLPMDEIVKKHGNIDHISVTIKTNCDALVPVEYGVDNVEPGHVIVIVNADGTQTIVPTTKMTENGLVFYCENGVAVKVIYNAKNFTDIKAGKWYNDAVDFVSAREIMTGMTATTFEPNGTTTRAQVWTMLARLAGVDTTCTEGNWYDVARAWAMENGISDGTGANDSITREQLVTMLYRFAQFQGKADGEAKSIADFSDAADASDWAKEALEWAYGMGVMNGNADGTMNPKGNTTRAEMAQFFMNFIQNI